MRRALSLLIVFASGLAYSQDQTIDALKSKSYYDSAFIELSGMLNGTHKLSFKRAVFITENAYLNNSKSFDQFNSQINLFADLCRRIAGQDNLIYNESDRERVKLYAAVFQFMKDSVKYAINEKQYFETLPYLYDFEDFWGERDWTKMFVTKLIETHSGNCHSLPILYKILCEELGVPAWLSMAPNHTYIKLWCKKTGWYNTELTSGYFPIDAWIMASGYVHLNAVQNRIYMDTLSVKQSISVCLIDLAKGYGRKFGVMGDPDFILECADLALKYYPNYINALILKAELTKSAFEDVMARTNATSPHEALAVAEGQELFSTMENLYSKIHNLGYRKMPKEMYAVWLAELIKEKEKYINKSLDLNQN